MPDLGSSIPRGVHGSHRLLLVLLTECIIIIIIIIISIIIIIIIIIIIVVNITFVITARGRLQGRVAARATMREPRVPVARAGTFF